MDRTGSTATPHRSRALARRVLAEGPLDVLVANAGTGTRILPVDPDDPDAMPLPVPVGHLGTPEDVAAMALAMVTNGYLTDKVVALHGGLHPA